MFGSKLQIAGGMSILSLILGGALVDPVWAVDPPNPGSVGAKNGGAGISADQFDKLRALIKSKPGGFDDLPWLTDLWEARKKAAAEGKPLLVWVGDGHPLGWT